MGIFHGYVSLPEGSFPTTSCDFMEAGWPLPKKPWKGSISNESISSLISVFGWHVSSDDSAIFGTSDINGLFKLFSVSYKKYSSSSKVEWDQLLMFFYNIDSWQGLGYSFLKNHTGSTNKKIPKNATTSTPFLRFL